MPKIPRGRYAAVSQFFADKIPASAQDFALMEAESRVRAFAIANVTSVEIAAQVRNLLERAVAEGWSMDQFREAFQTATDGWTARDAWHADLVYRENIQQAYSYGRMEEMLAHRKTHPFWRYSAVMDMRTRPSHAALNGVTLPIDAPFWSTHYPPWEFGCRCWVTAVRAEEADKVTSKRFKGPKSRDGYVSPGQFRSFSDTPAPTKKYTKAELTLLRRSMAIIGRKV